MHFNSWDTLSENFPSEIPFSFNFSESKDNTKYKSLSIDLKSTSSVTERLVVSTTYKTAMESAIFTR